MYRKQFLTTSRNIPVKVKVEKGTSMITNQSINQSIHPSFVPEQNKSGSGIPVPIHNRVYYSGLQVQENRAGNIVLVICLVNKNNNNENNI